MEAQAYGQSFSILCMELCIKDVNEATKDFFKMHQNFITFVDTPSWKFPHINMDKLDILPIMENYRNKSLTEFQHYQELLELLVDRVCYSLLTTCKLLESTMLLDNNVTQQQLHHQGEVGDSSSALSIVSLIPVSVRNSTTTTNGIKSYFSNKSIIDPNTNTHPNVGLLLKQLFDTVNAILECRNIEKEKSRKKNSKRKFTSTSSQTKDNCDGGCETCFVALNLLKFLATMITECLTSFSKSPSEISKLRQGKAESTTTLWNLSHKEFLYEWCEAVQSDCKTLLEKASTVFEEKTRNQKRYEECKSALDQETKKSTKLANDFHRKLKESQAAVELEKKKHSQLVSQIESQSTRNTELEVQFNEKLEQVTSLQNKVCHLTESMERANQLHNQLNSANSSAEKVKGSMEQEISSLKKQVHSLEMELIKKETVLELRDEEIETLHNDLDKLQRDEVKKDEMKILLEKAKKQLEACKKLEEENKRMKISDMVKMEKLREEVMLQQEQIELLTLYPDLNGPINPPSCEDGENPLKAMSNQVKSNQLRIQVLQAQTDRLNTTLEKCNAGGLGKNKSGKSSRVQFNE